MRIAALVLAITIAFALNLWVWLFPEAFIKYLRLGKNSRYMGMPLQKEIWHVIENPQYIWLPRVIFGLALVITIVLAYRIYFG
jgi:hypothetical protein